jgi:hypothetical protein
MGYLFHLLVMFGMILDLQIDSSFLDLQIDSSFLLAWTLEPIGLA